MNAPLAEAAGSEAVEVRIPAKAEWVAVVRLAVSAVASRLDFSVEDIEDVKLAIAEACTICIHRAAASDQIEIVCETHEGELALRVRGISSAQRPAVLSHPDDSPAFVIVESLMDSVETGTENGAPIIEMRKRASA